MKIRQALLDIGQALIINLDEGLTKITVNLVRVGPETYSRLYPYPCTERGKRLKFMLKEPMPLNAFLL